VKWSSHQDWDQGRKPCQWTFNATLTVSLDKPIALEVGSRFAIREGGKTVGSGVVTEV
jgi:elongation factor Tu